MHEVKERKKQVKHEKKIRRHRNAGVDLGSYKVLTRLSVGFALVSPLAALMLAGFPAQ